jgi:DMSO reductase anchor subunit
MLVLTQAGGGMIGGQVLWDAPNRWVCLAGLLLFQAGLVASVFHLGQPMKAWRVWMGWRTSWLSREAMVLGAVAGVLGVATAAVWGLASGWMTGMAAWVRTVGSVGVLAAVGAATFAQVMVYVDTRRPAWAWRQTGPRFMSTVLGGAVAGITMDRWGVAGSVAGLVLLAVMVFERRAFFRGMRGRTERTGEASH